MTIGSMNHEQCEAIRNAVHYHQTPFNVALIVEQFFIDNVDLTEKVKMMIAEQNKK